MLVRIILFISTPMPRVGNHVVIELSFEYDIWQDSGFGARTIAMKFGVRLIGSMNYCPGI